jgi:hypothetical protein
MSDPLFIESFGEVKKQLIKEWEHSEANDIDRREALYLSAKLVDRLRAHFESFLETGQVDEIYRKHPFI